MTIAKILADRTGEIWSCQAEDSVAVAVEMLATRKIGALPVYDGGDHVAGIFSERDVLYCLNTLGGEMLTCKVREVMTAPPITVDPDTPIDEALSLMTRRRIRHLPVVKDGKPVGFVSIGDLVKFRVDRIQSEAEAMREYIQSA